MVYIHVKSFTIVKNRKCGFASYYSAMRSRIPHRGLPPCRVVGLMHRWPGRFFNL